MVVYGLVVVCCFLIWGGEFLRYVYERVNDVM